MSRNVKTVKLATGVTLPYVEQGDPSGVPIVLLHGVTDSWRSFECVLPYLPPSLRVVAVTQRGHGDADRPDRGYETHDFAADVAALVEALDLGPVIVAGHSMGSFNALRFAIDHSEITFGLVLAGCSASWGANAALAEFWKALVSQLSDPIDPVFVREFQQSTVARPVPRSLIDTAVQESLKVPARVWRGSFAGFMERDFTEELAAVRAPTLLVWGDRDTLALRRDQDALLAGIAHARLFVYEGGGHALHWEQPQRFAADLADFARNVAKTRGACAMAAT